MIKNILLYGLFLFESFSLNFINRQGVAGGLFYKHLHHKLSQSFFQISSKHLHGLITWHMSCVTCYVSHDTCHMSQFSFFFNNVVKLVCGGFVFNGTYPIWSLTCHIIWYSIEVCHDQGFVNQDLISSRPLKTLDLFWHPKAFFLL